MKLYVRSDLERCARLAVQQRAQGIEAEEAVAEAVEVVAAESPEVYTQDQLLEVAHLAAQSAAKWGVTEAAERAVHAVTNTRHNVREQP